MALWGAIQSIKHSYQQNRALIKSRKKHKEILKDKKVNLAFTINNLLNTPYRENLNRLRYFADEIGRNFTIQLKFNY